eukprot:UN07176
MGPLRLSIVSNQHGTSNQQQNDYTSCFDTFGDAAKSPVIVQAAHDIGAKITLISQNNDCIVQDHAQYFLPIKSKNNNNTTNNNIR